jgi:hypothetical protein
MKAIWMAALVAVVGCGGGTNGADSGTGNVSTSCTMTFTGALTASNVACIVDADFDSSKNQGAIAIAYSGTNSAVSTFAMAVETTGQPQTGTAYTQTSSTSGSNMAVSGPGSVTWVAVGAEAAGSFSLNLSTLANSTSSGTVTVWTSLHGSATGTMQAIGNASGTVNVVVNF